MLPGRVRPVGDGDGGGDGGSTPSGCDDSMSQDIDSLNLLLTSGVAVAGIMLLLLTALAVVVPTFLVTLGLWLAGLAHPPETPDEVLQRARRHETLVTFAATSAGLLAATLLVVLPTEPSFADDEGWSPRDWSWAVAPFVGATVLAGVRAAGELTWPRPRGAVRVAPLARRTAVSVGGRRLVLLLVTVGVAVVTLSISGLTATSDGRHLAGRGTPGTSPVSGPYPGWPYGVPMLCALALALGATAVALRLIVRRPPLGGLATADDDALRRVSATRLLGGVQTAVGGGTSLLLVLAATVVQDAGWTGQAHAATALGLVVGAASGLAGVTGLAAQSGPRARTASPSPVGAP